MNTLKQYNDNFNDFETVFPEFGPLESVIKKVLKNRGIHAYHAKIVNDGWLRNHYVLKEDEEGEYVGLKRLPSFNENNNDLGWLNKAKRTYQEMLTNPPSKDLTTYFEIYKGLKLLAKKYNGADIKDKSPQAVENDYENLIKEAKKRVNLN